MDDSSDPRRFDFQPEFRWFTDSALRPVFDLNEVVLTGLVEAAKRPAHEMRVELAIELSDVLLSLDAETIKRMAQCPVCFLDAGFRDDARWLAVAAGADAAAAASECEPAFPRLQAMQWAQTTFTLAWTVARSSPQSAAVIFGMTPQCARIVAGLVVQTVERLAERRSAWIRPRWERQAGVWRGLWRTAEQSIVARIPPVGVRAMLQMLADLEPATCANAETRHSRR
jgi:hypothetical protein